MLKRRCPLCNEIYPCRDLMVELVCPTCKDTDPKGMRRVVDEMKSIRNMRLNKELDKKARTKLNLP